MPTENRSSNTENLPRPFCAGRVDPEGWLRGDGTRGPECESCGATAPTLSVWNSANPTTQPHHDPIAWMVGTAFWWTKEEAEKDAAETGLPIVGLEPMTESADIDQLQLEIAELQLALTMHDDAAIQDECIRAENSKLHAKLAEMTTYRDNAANHMRRIRTEATAFEKERDALRAQMAEAKALLREIHDGALSGFARYSKIEEFLSASAEPSAPNDCAICRDLGSQCMECEESEFREWADRHFAAADYRKTDAGVFIQDWMRHAYGAWCARGALASKQ